MELRFNNGSSVSLPSMKKLHFKPRLQSLVDSSQRNPLEFNAHEFTMNSFLGIRGSVANPRKYSPNNNSVLQFNDKVRIYIEKGNHLSVSGVTHNTQYRLKVDCDSPYSVDDFDNLLIAFKNTETNEKRFFKFTDINNREYSAWIYLNPGKYKVSLLPNLNFGNKKTELSENLSSEYPLLKMMDISDEDQKKAKLLLHAITA